MQRMTWTIDLTDWTDIPLTVDTNVSEVVAFKAHFSVMRLVVREGGVNRYTMNGSRGINFMAEFCVQEG